VDPGWDVIAETDLDCPGGIISVLDWAARTTRTRGPGDRGPGQYRLRVHARNRESEDEEHHQLTWPAVRRGDRSPLRAGEVAGVPRTGRDWELEPSRILPHQPTTVRISLRRDGKGTTAVELEQLNVPVELAGLVQPFWDWALRRALPDRVARSPFYGYPWHRV
jgi:hypothetical protein